jgi:SAM-dependent methyltransferase
MTISKRDHGVHDEAAGPDADAAYPLGDSGSESARLRRQSEQLRPESVALLDQIKLEPGQRAVDLGCGPSGILDLLSAAVSPGGRVVGLDANLMHVTMAREYADQAGLDNVEVTVGDARATGMPSDSFDLVHARTVLATLQEPAEVVAEMVRIAKPGGWVAGQEPDVECALCYPPLPAWDRLRELFRAGFDRMDGDLLIGRRLATLYREAGLEDIEVVVHAGAYPPGHSRRMILPDLVQSMRPVIVEFGLADERELADLDRVARRHLSDPCTLVMSELLVVVWGRKPY